jgi:hypothetical protein
VSTSRPRNRWSSCLRVGSLRGLWASILLIGGLRGEEITKDNRGVGGADVSVGSGGSRNGPLIALHPTLAKNPHNAQNPLMSAIAFSTVSCQSA